MSRGLRLFIYAVLAAFFLLHQDFWLWDDARLVFGLPVGLTYHLVYCVAASLVMALLVRLAWPSDLDAMEEGER